MKLHVLRGSNQEIAANIARMTGEVREAVVFVEEVSDAPVTGEDIFAEMEPYVVHVAGADYSREAVYGRAEGE